MGPSGLVPVCREDWSIEGKSRWKTSWKQRLVIGNLMLADTLLAFLIWWTAHLLQSVWGQGLLTEVAVTTVVSNVAVWIGLRTLLGLYPGYGLDEVEKLRRHTYAVLANAAVIAVLAVGFQLGDQLSRLQLALGFLGLLLLVPPLQYLVRRAMKQIGLWGKPVVILGSRNVGDQVTKLLRYEWELGYDPIAVFDYDPIHPGSTDPHVNPATEESLSELVELTRKRGIDTIVFATPNTRREQLAGLVGWAGTNFRHVLVIPNLGGMTNSAVVARDLAGTFAVEIKHNLLNPWALRSKQVFDLVATAVGGVLILPLILLIWLLVYLESGNGPVFYRDKRLGRDGRLFHCLKFRTMVSGAEDKLQCLLREDPEAREEYFEYHKLRDDPRITRVGRFLRKTSLDELPQLWNVLRGEMSLVGPRPYLPRESEEIGASQDEILRVPPGITGLWQVDGRNHSSFKERTQIDAYYVRDWSIWLDIVILARTAKTVLWGRGAY